MRGFVFLIAASTLAAASTDSCAVLPFFNASRNASASSTTAAPSFGPASNVDWLGVSIAQTLRDAFELRGMVTLGREDLQEAYHRLGLSMNLASRAELTQASVLKIGETLDAEQMIYGTFEVLAAQAASSSDSHGSLKISARVVDRRRLHESPEFSETGAIEDLSSLEAHLAWQALKIVAPDLAPQESEFRSLRPPVRLDAEENYIRGLMASDTQQREKFFLQAARLDARFAHPNYELGQIYLQRKEYRQAADALAKIGPDEIEFHHAAFLEGLALFQAGDFAGAQKALQSIVTAIPLSEVYNNLAASEGRRNLPQAIDDFRKALEGDMSDPVYQFNLGYALWKKGEFASAAELFRGALERNPDDAMATTLLGRCLKKQGLRPGDPGDARLVGLERVKTTFQERAYRQLKSLLASPNSTHP